VTYADLKTAIERSVQAVPFAPPVTKEYCEKVRDALRKEVPPGTLTEAYYRVASKRGPTEIVVEARSGAIVCTVSVTVP
jgi:hypothetical protein